MMCIEDGAQSGTQSTAPLKLKLVDLKFYRLGKTDNAPDARHATNEEFEYFISSIVAVGKGVGSNWTVTRRRDVLNFAFALKVLEVENNILHGPIKNTTVE